MVFITHFIAIMQIIFRLANVLTPDTDILFGLKALFLSQYLYLLMNPTCLI